MASPERGEEHVTGDGSPSAGTILEIIEILEILEILETTETTEIREIRKDPFSPGHSRVETRKGALLGTRHGRAGAQLELRAQKGFAKGDCSAGAQNILGTGQPLYHAYWSW